jgi:c-di-GMP-related signal transduction protein
LPTSHDLTGGRQLFTKAEKSRSPGQLDTAVDAGFDLFQGFIFSKPQILPSHFDEMIDFATIREQTGERSAA